MQSSKLQIAGTALSLLGLRLFASWEFLESGLAKWHGENWFADIQDQFPFPLSAFPAELNWQLAMYAELILPILLLLGLFSRLAGAGLAFVTAVAWYSVHAGAGYNVCDNGYKMALIYLLVLLPLILQGAGAVSLDFLLQKKWQSKKLHKSY